MMVLRQVVSAAEGYCLQLMVGQVSAECKTGSAEGAMERVTGVFHAVGLEGGFQASLWATKGKPSIKGMISRHTSGKGAAWAVS